jgi:site-specific recombinase XerD
MNSNKSSSLKDVREQFINFLQEKGRAFATVLAYGKDIEQLVNYLQKEGVSTIEKTNSQSLNKFLESLRKNGYTDKSVSRKINSIKTFYRFLHAKGIINENPAAQIRHPKIESKDPRILSKIEYRALRDAARTDPRIYAIIELFLQTGIRIGELSKIKLEDIREDKLIARNVNGQIDREIPLNKSAYRAIQRYIKVRPNGKSSNLFITKTGRPLLVRNIRTAIDRYFKDAGIKNATVNDLRNTFIAHQLASNAPLEYVSEIVGHKRVSTTEKYLDLIEKNDNHSKEPKLEEL